MTYTAIENLVEKLSLEFVLRDASEPESFATLSPLLEEIHGKSCGISPVILSSLAHKAIVLVLPPPLVLLRPR